MTLSLENLNLKNVINKEGLTYVVSTCYTYDRGYETMVFLSEYQPDTDNISEINTNLIDFCDIYQELHEDAEIAEERHKAIINKIKNFKSTEEKQISFTRLLEEK